MKGISDRERKMCLGKVKHSSLLAAQLYFDEKVKAMRPRDKHKLNIYQCPFCEKHHIGKSTETHNTICSEQTLKKH